MKAKTECSVFLKSWQSAVLRHLRPVFLRVGSITLLLGSFSASPLMAGPGLDLTHARLVRPATLSKVEEQAVRMLLDEVEKRTGIRWEEGAEESISGPSVVLAVASDEKKSLEPATRAGRPEGYRLSADPSSRPGLVQITGHDSRGLLFGIGKLLRILKMSPGRVQLDGRWDLETSPEYPLRGHQLGFRPKTNSYDGWDLDQWEQYFRDLIVFGANAIELIPPRSDDDADSPHFPRPPLEMMIGMSRLADSYGLDVWVWYPAMDPDYSKPETIQAALKEWGEIFQKLPRLDAVFVPGGDPGHTEPAVLLAFLEKEAGLLRQFHPQAELWVSPQGFKQEWLDQFVSILNRQQPAWLTGVVFGPQVRVGLPELRGRIPPRYPIRHYPDITHCRQCQYPVPDWDRAYALTEGREPINPRPLDQAAIFRATQPGTVGFITYSEGCNDDVNKTIWSALGWDSRADVAGILKDYARYFIGPAYEEKFSRTLLGLEQNWRGPLLENHSVPRTLRVLQEMERAASPGLRRNWRFQQALYRGYYDAYTQARLQAETDQEKKSLARLAGAKNRDTLAALDEAESVLGQTRSPRLASVWRSRIFSLADDLFHSIHMQLSVPLYRAIAVDRGANLDTVDFPLNNRFWLQEQFGRIRLMSSEDERRKALMELARWDQPGPGNFYDDLGHAGLQPHLARGPGLERDPGFMASPRTGFADGGRSARPGSAEGSWRLSWMDHAETLYDFPLQLIYEGLDPRTRYEVRVVYGGDSLRKKIRLEAGDHLQVHDYLARTWPPRPMTFALPPEATKSGKLILTWTAEPGLGGNGRGCQVSEVWLLRAGRVGAP